MNEVGFVSRFDSPIDDNIGSLVSRRKPRDGSSEVELFMSPISFE